MKHLKQTSLLLLSLFVGVAALSWQSRADTRSSDMPSPVDVIFQFDAKENPLDYVKSRLSDAAQIQNVITAKKSVFDAVVSAMLDIIHDAEFELALRETALRAENMASSEQISERGCYVAALLVLDKVQNDIRILSSRADSVIEADYQIRGLFARQLIELEKENQTSGCKMLYQGSQSRRIQPKSVGPSEHNDGGVERGRGGGGS